MITLTRFLQILLKILQVVVASFAHGYVFFALGGGWLFVVGTMFFVLIYPSRVGGVLSDIQFAVVFGAMLGILGAGPIGAIVLAVAALVASIRPHKQFNRERASFGGFWGGLILEAAGLPTFCVLIFLYEKNVPSRPIPANALAWWLVGTYGLGVLIGALVPGLPLWTLRRCGETWGQLRRMIHVHSPSDHEQ